MREQPGHIDQRELARTLHEQWGLAPGRLRHLPVGFGDHHWELTGAAGGRWFITVAELAGGWRGTGPAAGYADLRAAMETVVALRRAGLEFAIAPVPTASGQALARLDDGHAVTVFPHLDASPRASCWPGTPPSSAARWRASMSWCATPPAAGRR